jgi:YYY domain-containing protein
MSDFSSVVSWWLAIFTIGIIFFPTTFYFFHKFLDKGYIFSKIIGILIVSYLIWILGSLKLLPFSRLVIIVVLLGAMLFNLWIIKRINKIEFKKLPFWLFILEEIFFFLTLSFWSYVRATEPSIRGLEKFMDFGFVNSILRGNFFPPLDMWLTYSPDYSGGYFINYYYFGHYVTAFLTKLTAIDSAITYNLMLATLFAFTFTLSFSIGMNLYFLFKKTLILKAGDAIRQMTESRQDSQTISNFRAILVGILAGFLVAMAGNTHTLYSFTDGYPNEDPKPPWQLSLGFHPERYWYPNATRFIPFTIHEFPIYSFVVADLHGHVSDIPFVLLSLALLLSILTGRDENGKKEEKTRSNFFTEFRLHTSISFPTIAFLGVLLSCMYMTNAWDGAIYMILAGLVFLYINLQKRVKEETSFLSALYKTFSASLFLLFFFLIANLPFSLNFKPFVSGIGVLCGPAFLIGKKIGPFLFEEGKCQKSPFFMLAILWGFFYFNVIGYLIFVIIPELRSKTDDAKEGSQTKLHKEALIKNIPLNLGGLKRSLGNLSSRIRLMRINNPIDIFILLIIIISSLLLIFPEFFYMKDIYPAHYRANTMFKLGYQAFMMLGLASSFIVFKIADLKLPGITASLWRIGFSILFLLVGIYPYFAINSYYGGLKTYRGLYGLSWMQQQYPDDYKGVEWLRQNIPWDSQPVIVEANGDSYTDYARVSAYTGLPTIIGWPVHEWLWRGSYDEAGRRIPEVAAVYEQKDQNLAREILKKYKAEYIFVGSLEKEKYKALDEKKLESLGKVVFESGGTKIYKLNSFLSP